MRRVPPSLCAASDVIPLKFQRASGVKSHSFRIATRGSIGSPEAVTEFPVFVLMTRKWSQYRVPINRFPAEVEALTILAQIDGETERQGRYINIHSAYEAVVRPRDMALSAIRHALAHPITSLTHSGVRTAILDQFGSLHINLTKYQHQKVYYCAIGAMLIAIDVAIYRTFSTRIKELVPTGALNMDVERTSSS